MTGSFLEWAPLPAAHATVWVLVVMIPWFLNFNFTKLTPAGGYVANATAVLVFSAIYLLFFPFGLRVLH